MPIRKSWGLTLVDQIELECHKFYEDGLTREVLKLLVSFIKNGDLNVRLFCRETILAHLSKVLELGLQASFSTPYSNLFRP